MSFRFPGPDGPGRPSAPQRLQIRRPRLLLPVALIVLAILILGGLFIGFYTDLLWYQSIGFSKVYITELTTKALLFVVFGLLMGGAVFGNLFLAYRLRPNFRARSLEQESLARYRDGVEQHLKALVIGICVVFGVFAGTSASGEWRTWLLWRNATSFGHKDPEFGRDVSYFAFTYPFQRFLLGFAVAIVLVSIVAAVLTHYLYGGVSLSSPVEKVTRGARAHIAALLGVFVLLKAVAYYLDRFGLAFSERGVRTGLSYTDVNAVLPAKTILGVITLICAAMFVATIFRKGWLLPGASLALLALSALVVGGLYPLMVQQFQVKPSEQDKEAASIGRNIEQTRYAYGLDAVQTTEYLAKTTTTPEQLAADAATTAGVRLLDPTILPQTYKQLQQIRNFYGFSDALDVDRYKVDGKQQDVVIAVRELDLREIPAQQRTWVNERLVYTHGFGVVAAPGNGVDADGKPDFIEKNIPPTGTLGDFEPRIYFGEQSPSYSIVGAGDGVTPIELDHPTDGGEGQIYSTYDGDGGVALSSPLRKLLYALKFKEKNILLADGINSSSRILYDRNPRERVAKAAPYLKLDGDPYPAIVDGRMLWIVDGYTTSSGFPYSERESLGDITADANTATTETVRAQEKAKVNYIRNSVKATVDAYTGKVTLYQWDEQDPVLKTWMKAFPGTVQPKSEISADLLAHVRYPEDLFKVQRKLLASYHVTDPHAFYLQQDFWEVPTDPTKGNATADQPPYYLTLQMPGTQKPSFSLTTTFTPRGRPQLSAFMAVSSDPGEDYGKIRVLELPRSTTINGPGQMQSQYDASPTVQEKLNVLKIGGGGSRIEYGNLLTLPVGGGLLYVEPVYVRAAGGESYPLMQKVLVSFGDKIAFEDTFDKAISVLFDQTNATPPGTPAPGTPTPGTPAPGATPTPGATPPPATTPTESSALKAALADAQKAFADGQAALKDGDFAAYGEAQKRLSAALDAALKAEGK